MSARSGSTNRSGRPVQDRLPPRPAQDSALLLKRTPYGESSLVVHVLSAKHGRVELIAKGAHRPKSRFSGVLDWFDTLGLDWNPPREASTSRTETARISSLGTLRTGDVDVRRRWITGSLETYRAAHTAIELVEHCTRSGFVDGGIYSLLAGALDELNLIGRALSDAARASEAPDLSRLAHLPLRLARFELRLLQVLGLEPSMRVCATCGDPAPAVPATGVPEPRAPFSPQAGGRLCPRHASEVHARGVRIGTLPVAVLEAAHELLHGGQEALARAKEPDGPEFGERVLDFASRFLDHQLQTRPKSHAEFLGAPDRNRRARATGPDERATEG
ncbi:DNA repair protein RecO [Planctomycetes bacterium Poly30]|uniref:DNA repair protein RecO n=1 Tax=Saltatorellus ferox TaxID=2528018 RepID=A0A518EQD3_9BACT|nr:DNA repair protein RecO [Planctomycetes bacterium Poly30]